MERKGIPEGSAGQTKKKINKKAYGAIAAAVAAVLVLVFVQTAKFSSANYFNILMKDYDDRTVLGSEISRDSIKSVTFMDTLEGMPDTAWDVSQDQDGSVMAWTQQSTDDNSDDEMYDLFIAGEGGVQGRDCRKLFRGYYSAEKIDFNNCFDTSRVTDMPFMFYGCSSLEELDLSGFATS